MIYQEINNNDENVQEEIVEDVVETNSENSAEEPSTSIDSDESSLDKNQNDISEELTNESKEVENTVSDLNDNTEDEQADKEESAISNESSSEVQEILVDYLSSDILNVREVSEADLIDNADSEEKFILNEDLVVNVKKNNIVHGNVVNVSDRDVFIDIGFKTEGIVPLSEFKNPPIIGKELEVVVEKFEDTKGNLLLSKEKADFIKRWDTIKTKHDNEETINGTIIRRIKGGMVVDLDVIQAFLPGSQIDIKPVTDFDDYLGKEFEFKIVKINELRKNVVLSRKELLATDLQEKRKKVLEEMEEGMVLEGIVKNITDFGAFIDLGGIDGLLHITDITWGRINHPSEKLEIGQTIEVKVIDFDLEKLRVSLGRKQLTDEPWKDIGTKYAVGSTVSGKVVNMMNYGLFIELEEGVEGLIHISEISWNKHIKHPSEVYQIGDMVDAQVLSVEETDKKISLGIKQLSANPWDEIENNYNIGDIHTGVVKNLTQFGAFVNLDGNIDGLLHVSDMSWTKIIRHPKDFVQVGDEVEVKILEVSSEDKKVSLGVKQLKENPWEELSSIFTSGANIKGTAVQINSNNVIFDLEHEVEGIMKTSGDGFELNKEYNLTVQGIDEESKKVIIMSEKIDESISEETNEENSSENEASGSDEVASSSEESAPEESDGSEE